MKSILNTIQDHFKQVGPSGLKTDLRATIAFLIGCIFCVIPQISQRYGFVAFLAPVIVVLFDHTQSIGSLMQMGLLTSIGTSVGCALMCVVLLAAVDNEILFLTLLFLITYVLTYLRAWNVKLMFPALLATIPVVLGSIIGFYFGKFVPDLIKAMLIMALCGIWISVVTSCFVFPVSTHDKLKGVLKSSFDSMKFHLELSDRLFLIEADDKDEKESSVSAHQKAQDVFLRLSQLSTQLNMEFYIGYDSHAQYQSISNSAKKMIQYLALLTAAAQTEFVENRQKQTMQTVVAPLKEPLIALTKASTKNIDTLAKAVMKGDSTGLSKLNDLILLFEQLSMKLSEETEHLPSSNSTMWQDLFHVYFYLFNIQKFVEELDQLGKEMRAIHQHKTIHFPGRASSDSDQVVAAKSGRSKEGEEGAGYRLWKFLSSTLATKESKYAFKTATAITLLTAPLMFRDFTSTYQEWHGEWAVVTVPIISSISFSDTWMNGTYRIIGTIMGAFTAALFWLIAGKNPYILLPLIALYALILFHIKQNTTYPRFGNVSLLTFTIILFTKYSVSGTLMDVDMVELAYKRALSVSIGVIFMGLVNRILWPFLSRTQLRQGVASVIRDLAALYSSTVSSFVKDNVKETEETSSKLENSIQLSIINGRNLLRQTASEPRIKGEFPSIQYQHLLNGCQRLLDHLISLRMLEKLDEQVRQEIMYPLNPYRKEIVKQVLLLFHVVSGAILSRSPLPMYLPDALEARNQLLSALPSVPVVKEGRMSHEKFLHYYVYAIFTREIISEVEKLAQTAKSLFGTDKHIDGMFESDNKVRTD